MSPGKQYAVVVDAYGPGKFYPALFQQHGVSCIHVQSTSQPLPALTPVDLPAFLANFVHEGDLQQTAQRILALVAQHEGQLLCVIPGVEPGVELADQLSELFGVVSNGSAQSGARRNKYLMAAALQQAGVRIPRFFKSGDVEALVAYAEGAPEWPLVVKPLDSAGSNGVFICNNVDEIRHAFAQVIGQTNNMGRVNQEMLIQSFLDGPEYMVNTVSHAGRHYVSDIWHARKIRLESHGFIYDRNDLLAADDPAAVALAPYVGSVLDALGIANGPAHAEVIMTSTGPVLVEVGARISGLVDPSYNDSLLGHNQIGLTVEAYVAPQRFAHSTAAPYVLRRHGMQVCLISAVSGTVKAVSFSEALGDLESLFSMGLKIRPGSQIKRTIDLSSCPGVCNLGGADPDRLEHDFQRIRTLFASGVELESVAC